MPEWPRAIKEEMRQHLDDEYAALRGRGLSHDEAMRALAGDVDAAASLRPRPLDALTADLRYGLRTLRNAPGFTAVVMLTLALGIGATTAVFSVVETVMLRPYPYADMARIVAVAEATRAGQIISIAWPNFVDWRTQNQVFEALGVYRPMVVNLTGGDQPERLVATGDEDKPGAARIAVVSERLWRSHFNADAGIVGRPIVLDGQSHTIVGVMPAAAALPIAAHRCLAAARAVRADVSG